MSIVVDLRQVRELPRAERRERTAELLDALIVSTDVAEQQRLRGQLVCLHLGVARSVATRFFRRGIDEDDLVQVAFVALTKAARDFDPARRDFLAYAVPTIRGELKKHFRDRGWTVRPPRRVQETQHRIARAEGDLVQQLGRSPRPSELAAHLGQDPDEVIEAMSADGCFTPTSLDQRLAGRDGTAGFTIGDLLGGAEPGTDAVEARTALAPVVRHLKERDRQILYLRYFEDRTQQEIADLLGVTQMQVSRLLARILRDLRRSLTDEPEWPRATAGQAGPARDGRQQGRPATVAHGTR